MNKKIFYLLILSIGTLVTINTLLPLNTKHTKNTYVEQLADTEHSTDNILFHKYIELSNLIGNSNTITTSQASNYLNEYSETTTKKIISNQNSIDSIIYSSNNETLSISFLGSEHAEQVSYISKDADTILNFTRQFDENYLSTELFSESNNQQEVIVNNYFNDDTLSKLYLMIISKFNENKNISYNEIKKISEEYLSEHLNKYDYEFDFFIDTTTPDNISILSINFKDSYFNISLRNNLVECISFSKLDVNDKIPEATLTFQTPHFETNSNYEHSIRNGFTSLIKHTDLNSQIDFLKK